ncbi:MAG: putative metal-binding motif-containing protein, partial [Myxococcales bacterium]|nr:putative metal-binding motif-containing protein [Myxococcales bacterium]
MTNCARTAPEPRAAHLASTLLALALLALPACHDSAPPGLVTDTTVADDAPDAFEIVQFDTLVPDTAADTTPDVVDTSPADTVPSPGELGWPCASPDDCNGGWCLDGRDGRVCSKACTETCPLPGWSCRQNVAVLPDIAFVCMPPMPTLCRPCTANADCVVASDTTAHACVPLGDDGAFCGGLCAGDADCPGDFFCATVKDIAGNTTRQCLPESGQCDCSGSAIAAEAATTCVRANAYGRCDGGRRCTESGLSACDAPIPILDECDGVDSNCDGQTDEAFLAAPCERDNADGRCAGVTACGPDGVFCDALEPSPERCGNGVDDDCDGATDDEGAAGCALTWYDGDGDGQGTGDPRCLCAPDGRWSAPAAGDCDDAARRVYEGAAELCNAIDDDCDGDTDEDGALGCTVYHADVDGDGFGDADDSRCLCAPDGVYTALSGTDCDDGAGDRNPAVGETCNGHDDDCDGETDEEGAAGCGLYFADGDLDRFGAPGDFRCLCGPGGLFTATTGGDCDDSVPGGDARNPGLVEICDGIDNDCDGLTDEPGAEGCVLTYRDHDGDHFGLASDALCLCGDDGEYRAAVAGDCDDDEVLAYPGADESCDGVDNDCDDVVDEEDATGCATFHADRDRDEHGVAEARCLCGAAIPFTATTTDDCDDTNPFIHPGGTEVCNSLDDDCNDETDEGVTGQCSPFYKDADHDGWGDEAVSECLCAPDGDFTSTKPGDCDDTRTAVYPFAQELCNGRDDDCDGHTDEQDALGCVVYFKDADGDGAGRAADSRCLCAPDAALKYTALAPGDCDDADRDAAPGKPEACNDKDDDCDGLTDERGAIGCQPFMRDTDHDTWGVALDTQCLCEPGPVYSAQRGGDCDDLRDDISPGHAEVCDGADNDCNGIADDPGIQGCVDRYQDRDGDTFGVDGDVLCTCAPLGTYTATRGGDCQDLLGAVNPDAIERCNAVDDDCDHATDEADAVGCVAFLKDVDGDHFGIAGDSQCLCQPGPTYRAVVGGDCDDARSDLNPGETEVCNGADDDCDGHTDDDGAGGCQL